jgi:hypothetical protein
MKGINDSNADNTQSFQLNRNINCMSERIDPSSSSSGGKNIKRGSNDSFAHLSMDQNLSNFLL